MLVSLVTIPLNGVLNALLIFGLGPFPELGIAGAAWGTVLTSVATLAIYVPLFLSGNYALTLVPGGRQWDTGTAVEIVRIGIPLTGRQMANTIGNFPFLAILAVLGTPVVAAYAIGQQLMRFAMIPGYGYSTASSAMVGQKLGEGDPEEATSYGWQTVRLGIATQVLIGAVLVAFARPLVAVFNTEAMELSILFTWALAAGIVGNSIAMALQGGLRGAGDTIWPMYGSVIGMTLRLGLAVLALPAGYLLAAGPIGLTPGLDLGIWVVLLAVIVDRYVRAAVNAVRFHGGKWRAVARRSATRTGLAETPDSD
jgi:putative MATE family efflux protein